MVRDCRECYNYKMSAPCDCKPEDSLYRIIYEDQNGEWKVTNKIYHSITDFISFCVRNRIDYTTFSNIEIYEKEEC